ncbi:MAG: hypothetical protein WA303_01680 [Bradyrhizobium sp.]
MRRHSKGTETKPDVRNAAGTAFVFVPRFVCPGDILLTRVPFDLLDPSTYAGVAIRGATLAPFSHAALCIEPGLMIEAIGTGVCRLALGQTGSRQRRNVKLLRLTLDVPDGHIIAQKAAFFGHQYLSRGYSIPGAIGTRIAALRKENRGDLFCSELVARAYREAGYSLLPGKGPGEIAPGDLLKSDALRDVTKLALLQISTDRPFAFYLDDGSHFERPVHWEVKTKLEILRSGSVARELDAIHSSPESFFELEKVLRTCLSPNLDTAVHNELVLRSFKEQYLEKSFAAVGISGPAEVWGPEFELRFHPTDAELEALTAQTLQLLILDIESSILSFRNDVKGRKTDIESWQSYRTDNNTKTFSYLEDMQTVLLLISERTLSLFEQQRELLRIEENRRGRFR